MKKLFFAKSLIFIVIVGIGVAIIGGSYSIKRRNDQIVNDSKSIVIRNSTGPNKTKVVHFYKKGSMEFEQIIEYLTTAPSFTKPMAQSMETRLITINLQDGSKTEIVICLADGRFKFLDQETYMAFPIDQIELIK